MFGAGPAKKYYQEILPNFYHFAEGPMLDCNIYAIKNQADNITLIDTGNGLSLSALEKSFEELNWQFKDIESILITHEHVDHVVGLYKLKEKIDDDFPIIYSHQITADILQKGEESQIIPPMFNISAQNFGINIEPLKSTKSLGEGDHFSFGPFNFQILHTPGHSRGSICYYDEKHQLLLSGDVVFPNGSFGRYDFPGCSLDDLIQSISRLTRLKVKVLCAGHMAPITKMGSEHIQRSYQNIQGMRF